MSKHARRIPRTRPSGLDLASLTARTHVQVASDALDQEMRFASEDVTIAFVWPDDLEGWIRADDPDEFLETLIRRAILR